MKSLNHTPRLSGRSSKMSKGSVPSTARRSVNADQQQSLNPSPSSKAPIKKSKNGGSTPNRTDNLKDNRIESICETFIKTTSNFKQFQSGKSLITIMVSPTWFYVQLFFSLPLWKMSNLLNRNHQSDETINTGSVIDARNATEIRELSYDRYAILKFP